MYPISNGYGEVVTRLEDLTENGHHAEALLAAVFAIEKTLRRALRFCMINRGFTSKHCNSLLARSGFGDMQNYWPVFDKAHRTLPEVIGSKNCQLVSDAVKMRNQMVHGLRVLKLEECQDAVSSVRNAMDVLRRRSISELDFDPWSTMPRKIKPSLTWLSIQQPTMQ